MQYSQETDEIIGLADADLLDNGTRHPNLVLLKIAGFLNDNKIKFELILDSKADTSKYSRIYLSKVFSFTQEPEFLEYSKDKTIIGGTGYYANEPNVTLYTKLRNEDMERLHNDEYLNSLPNKRGGYKKFGIDMARQMPYYHLYDSYVEMKVEQGYDRKRFVDYEKFSIGFLTRGCVRHCPFCINKLENKVLPYSRIEWFLDNERDEKGRLLRPYIYLWDDNFLASDPMIWRSYLKQLNDTGRQFQFRQGLDERMLAQSPHGLEMAEILSKSKYHGDFIFAFDNWRDRELIEKALKIWKHYNPKKGTKFYLFCGFKLTSGSDDKFYKDIWELFQRIKVLMSYGCVGYVMRHEDYHKYELSNLYVQIARWCNQQAFYKKMSFWEFCYRNQSFWEENTLKITDRPKLKTFDEFMTDFNNGYYDKVKMCLPLRTFIKTLDKFPDRREELLEMFNYKMEKLRNPKLWE